MFCFFICLQKSSKSTSTSAVAVEGKKLNSPSDFAVEEEKKIMKKLMGRAKQQEKDATKNEKILHKCLKKFLNKNFCTHELLKEDKVTVVVGEEVIYLNFSNCQGLFQWNISFCLLLLQMKSKHNRYLDSGIYEDKFGNSCKQSVAERVPVKCEAEPEDFNNASWFQTGLIGEMALEMLTLQNAGSFLVHKGASKSGNLILSLCVPLKTTSKISHHLILHSKTCGYRLKGSTKDFPTITSLVTHHSVMAEHLPVTLLLPRPQNIPSKNIEDYDNFSSIEDLQSIFTDLEL